MIVRWLIIARVITHSRRKVKLTEDGRINNNRSRPDIEIPKSSGMKVIMKRSGISSLSRPISWTLPILIALMLLAGFYWQQPGPCQEPVTYRIGSVDAQFKLSRQEVAEAINKAASVWGEASNHELFREKAEGMIEINLVYDYRQAAADKLKGLSYKIDNTKSSYDALKSWLENQEAVFKQKETALVSDIDSYNARVNALKTESDTASQKGGVSEDLYQRFMAEKEALDVLREDLQMRQVELKESADNLNTLVVGFFLYSSVKR